MDPNTAQNLLDRYILDYMKKRGLNTAAACFASEARIADQHPAIDDVPLSDWWAIFSDAYFSDHRTFPLGNVSSNLHTQTPMNNVVIQPSTDDDLSRMHLSPPPLNVAQQNLMMQHYPNDDLETNIINIFSSSDELQTSFSQQDDSLSSMIPPGIPFTHFLDDFHQEYQTSNPESTTPQIQGGDVAKDDKSIENNIVAEDKILGFMEVVTFFTSNDKVLCCHFSSDGKLLATAGNDKMVSLWNVESQCHLGNTPQQSNVITDVRFKPHSTVFATCFDTTIRLWDAANVSKLLVELDGHVDPVMSVDFNPYESDILCSCDCKGEMRLWDINKRACIATGKVDGGMRQLRFQLTNLFAVASGKLIVLTDMKTNKKIFLKGHRQEIRSICWDVSGRYLASVSEDSARVWSTNLGWKCDYELHTTDNMFQSCTFHPVHSLLLVIGGFKVIELWDCVKGSKMRTVPIHEGSISALTYSSEAGLIASASSDGHIRLWR